MKHLLKCVKCSSYTLNEKCACSGEAIAVRPPKYTPQDKYARHRREAKSQERKANKLI